MKVGDEAFVDELLSLVQAQDRLIDVLEMILNLNDIPLGEDVIARSDRCAARLTAVRDRVHKFNREQTVDFDGTP